jgi:hypothetical protein
MTKIEEVRKALFEQLRTGNRDNRRATVAAFNLVNKACNILKLPRLDRAPRFSKPQTVVYPATDEKVPAPTPGTLGDTLATNATETDDTTPKRTRKSKKV